MYLFVQYNGLRTCTTHLTSYPIHWITDFPKYILQISSPKTESDHDKGTAKKFLAAVEANQMHPNTQSYLGSRSLSTQQLK